MSGKTQPGEKGEGEAGQEKGVGRDQRGISGICAVCVIEMINNKKSGVLVLLTTQKN